MKKREIIATLIEVSDDLDNMGLFSEADQLTRVAQYFGELEPTDYEFNPDNDGTEHGFLGEDQYERDNLLLRQMQQEEALEGLDSRIEELKNIPHPTEKDLAELSELLDYRMGKDFNPNAVEWPRDNKESEFIKNLSDAGADIVGEEDPFRD